MRSGEVALLSGHTIVFVMEDSDRVFDPMLERLEELAEESEADDEQQSEFERWFAVGLTEH